MRFMSEENEVHLSSEITSHFKLLKKATILFGSLITLTLVPAIGLLWSLKAEQIRMSKDYIKQSEVYDNFVNKGQYIFLEGEWCEIKQNELKGIDISDDLKKYGIKIREVLEIKYRGSR